jgi:hypothetical protein
VAPTREPDIKISDIRFAIIGDNPTVRILTDAGHSGFWPVNFILLAKITRWCRLGRPSVSKPQAD